MDKWEYMVKAQDNGISADMLPRCNLENALNYAGEDGWDLVSAIPVNDNLLLIMKRPKQ